MNDTTEQLIRERDEARAAVVALREALEKYATMWGARSEPEIKLVIKADNYGGHARATLAQPSPGAALLERLKAAEAELEAVRKARQVALNAPLEVLSLIEYLASEADNHEATDERKNLLVWMPVRTLRQIRKLLPWARETLGAMMPGAGCDYGDDE